MPFLLSGRAGVWDAGQGQGELELSCRMLKPLGSVWVFFLMKSKLRGRARLGRDGSVSWPQQVPPTPGGTGDKWHLWVLLDRV